MRIVAIRPGLAGHGTEPLIAYRELLRQRGEHRNVLLRLAPHNARAVILHRRLLLARLLFEAGDETAVRELVRLLEKWRLAGRLGSGELPHHAEVPVVRTGIDPGGRVERDLDRFAVDSWIRVFRRRLFDR